MLVYLFCKNFGKRKSILIFFHFHMLQYTAEEARINAVTLPQICATLRRNLNAQLYNFSLILARIFSLRLQLQHGKSHVQHHGRSVAASDDTWRIMTCTFPGPTPTRCYSCLAHSVHCPGQPG